MGIEKNAVYQTRRINLNAGDMLKLYTDGVTGAGDEGGGFYTPERLIAAA